MGYTVLNNNAVFPAQVSYQLIALTSNIIVTWPFSFASGTIIASINDVNASAGPFSITLPAATLASIGQTILFNNVGANSFRVYANDGTTLLDTVTSGQTKYYYLYDNTSGTASNGLWRIIPFGGGATAITNFTAGSSDSTITITGGTVTAPSGTINFKLPTSIANLNSLSQGGFPVITDTSPLTWDVRDIVGGDNINIDNSSGIGGNPIINLTKYIDELTGISVGNLAITGSSIDSIAPNTGVTIASGGTGLIDLNGVTIDIGGNIVEVNNLTVNGTFYNSYTPKAWCIFTDALVGTNTHNIIVRNQANIASVTGGAGQYTLTFAQPLTNNYYGVLVTLGTENSGGLPVVSHGFSVFNAQTTTSCQIAVVDASGEYIQQAQNGITVQILSAN